MSTISKAKIIPANNNICQGDVFKNIRYTYIEAEDNESVQVVEFIFPMAIIISQACDVNSMGEMILTKEGKATKFMPSILMCPIYDVNIAKRTNHLNKVFTELEIEKLDGKSDVLFNSSEFNVAENDWHYRYHALTVEVEGKKILENVFIDFKHYFTIPASWLIKNRSDRLFHIENLFSEQITLKFATYLSRVAIP